MIKDQEKDLGYSEAYDLLSKFKIKPTKQRMLITKEVFSKTPKHFTVQDIFVSHIEQNIDCDVFFSHDLTSYNETLLKTELENNANISFFHYSTS